MYFENRKICLKLLLRFKACAIAILGVTRTKTKDHQLTTTKKTSIGAIFIVAIIIAIVMLKLLL